MSERVEILVGSRKGQIAEPDSVKQPSRANSTTRYLWLRSLDGEDFGWYRESEVAAVSNQDRDPASRPS